MDELLNKRFVESLKNLIEEKHNMSGAYQGAKYSSYNGRILEDLQKEKEHQFNTEKD